MTTSLLPPMSNDAGLSRRARWTDDQSIVSILMAKALAHPELVSLAAGFVDQGTLPVEPSQKAIDTIWSDPHRAREALQYGTTVGYPPLRQAVLERMLSADGMSAAEAGPSIDQVVITAGSNQLLYLAGDVLLDPGDIVLCGAPSYFVYLGTLAGFGVRTVGVEIDEHGLIPEAIADQLGRYEAAGELGLVKAIYVTSYYDNPSGVTVPAQRRAEIVEIAKRWSRTGPIHVIEDAAYRELRYYGGDIPSMRSFDQDGDTVIVAGTFSKSFSPGIRVGWGILPGRLVEPVLNAKGNLDFGSPNFNQTLMATVLELGLFEDHLEWLRQEYRRKIDATLEAADAFLAPLGAVSWVRPTGGLYVWIRMPGHVDTGVSGDLFNRAAEEGVLYVPGDFCYPREGRPVPKNMLRLSFGVPSCDDIRRGIQALARAVRQVSG
jgi:2-aminoadipate transaminase